jgi:Ca2+-binding RTX toxin-like protein
MSKRIVFIDSGVEGARGLVAGLGDDTRVAWLDAGRDPLAQMTAVMAVERDISHVELISHGRPGALLLGSTSLTEASLNAGAAGWQQWRSALGEGASILLYGCHVGATEAGRSFVSALAALTGAAVAASQTLTGSARLGGEWLLGVRSGNADTRSVLDFAAFGGTLAVIPGTGGNDSLVGTGADDAIDGLAGNDTLDGGGGTDTLTGGLGDDFYITDGADTLTEAAAEGADTVQSSVSFTLGAEFENLVLTGFGVLSGTGNALANTIAGTNGSNRLDGGGGADTLIGALGDDTYFVDAGDTVTEVALGGLDTVWSGVSFTLPANVEDLILTGSAAIHATGNLGDNRLIGNDGDNSLDGAAGNDTLYGGAGNDTYIVDSAFDVVVDEGGGSDTVRSAVSWTLGDAVEILVLTGTGAINGTGNAADNAIEGNAGANVLSGGEGYDVLVGGAGNDTYVFDNVDNLVEYANQGSDTIQSAFSLTLAEHFETLTLTGTADITGTGNAAANRITGNAGANVLNGGAGVDTLAGGEGDDTYLIDSTTDTLTELAGQGVDTVQSSVTVTALGANIENLVLVAPAIRNGTGNELDNRITGTDWAGLLDGAAGNDTLDGNGGRDTLVGGAGDDVFITDGNDTITELSGGGSDTVHSSADVTLAGHVENLLLTGQSGLRGTGNELANQMTGNAGANELDGAGGADTLAGGAGNDSYVFDGTDTLIEAAGAGVDVVLASVDATLGSHFENLVLVGGALNGTGNDAANRLTGNAGNNALIGLGGNDTLNGADGADRLSGRFGNDLLRGDAGADYLRGESGADTLIGGTGRDTLVGGAGADVFVFDAPLEAPGNVDLIRDFASGTDRIRLDDDVFTTLAAGVALTEDQFLAGAGLTVAADAEDRIIYNTSTGALYYDADGTGNAFEAVRFAVVGSTEHPVLGVADFLVSA